MNEQLSPWVQVPLAIIFVVWVIVFLCGLYELSTKDIIQDLKKLFLRRKT